MVLVLAVGRCVPEVVVLVVLSLLLLSIFFSLSLSLFCSFSLALSLSLSRSFVCKQPGLRIRDRMRSEFPCTCYRFLAEFIRSFKTIKP